MFLLTILLYIVAILGFVTCIGLTYSYYYELSSVVTFGFIPSCSVIAWFLLPAYKNWIVGINFVLGVFFLGAILWLEFGQKIYWHFKVKELRRCFDRGELETKRFKELHSKVDWAVYMHKGTSVSYKDCFRFYMFQIEAGMFDSKRDMGCVKQIVREAKITMQEYEKYRDTIEVLEYEYGGKIYSYGTDRDGCSRSGVSDKVRFKPRILS